MIALIALLADHPDENPYLLAWRCGLLRLGWHGADYAREEA